MDAIELIQRLHQHRAWVNDNLMAAAAGLSDEQLRQSFPIGQGSVWKSLVHLHAAEFVWLGALEGDESPLLPGDLPGHLPGNQRGENRLHSLTALGRNWSELARRWESYLKRLSANALDEPVYKIVSSTGQRISTGRSDILLHVCTHAQYTAAQVVNMLRQLGVEKLPETMLISMGRAESRRGDSTAGAAKPH